MRWRSRWFALALFSVAYVGWAALRASGEPRLRFVLLAALLLGFASAWAAAGPPEDRDDWAERGARSALRACLWGAFLLAASLLGPADRHAILAITMAATALATTSALVALARIAPAGGLAQPPAATRGFSHVVFCAALGALFTIGPLLRAFGLGRRLLDASAVHAIATSGGIVALGVVLTVARGFGRARRLEIGVADRLEAAFYFALAAALAGLPAALLAPSGAEARTSAAFATSGALLVAITTVARDPARVRRAQRTGLALVLIDAPLALLALSVASQVPLAAPAIAAAAAVLGAAAGLAAVALGKKDRPDTMRWRGAIEKASLAAQRLDPEGALVSALVALRETSAGAAASPAIFRLDPPEMLEADRAGYPHRTPDRAPPADLVRFASQEPWRTLQAAAAEALEIRRTDVRAASAWLRERDLFSVTVLDDGNGIVGLLAIPSAGRDLPLCLEEARELEALGSRLAALVSASAALARSRARELEARDRADRADEKALGLSQVLGAREDRFALDARRLARPALLATYSAAARMANDRLRALGAEGGHVALLMPPGTDPLPYAALVHLSSPRSAGPLVVVDAADATDSPAAALAVAEGGTLVVASGAAMPASLQDALEHALLQGAPFGVIVAVPATVDTLVARGLICAGLADHLGDRAVAIPPLAARAEDLRAILLDRLARIGVRLRGHPFGLEPRALGRLIEHAWTGNDLEVDDVLTRAALGVAADVVTTADLDRIGFAQVPVAVRRSSRPPGEAPAKG